jgi:hypothetical protein
VASHPRDPQHRAIALLSAMASRISQSQFERGSASELLLAADEALSTLDRGLFVNEKGQISLPCLVCGKDICVLETVNCRVELMRTVNQSERATNTFMHAYCCDICTHRAFFLRRAFPRKPRVGNGRRFRALD